MGKEYPSSVLLACLFLANVPAIGQQAHQREEITYISNIRQTPDLEWQAELRHGAPWRQFKTQHPRWSVEFNEATGMPRRAYGDPIMFGTGSQAEQAIAFLSNALPGFDVPADELVLSAVAPTKKLTYVHLYQQHQGLRVLGAKGMVKFDSQGRVIGFAADLIKDIEVDLSPTLDANAAVAAASQGLVGVVDSESEGLRLLPIPTERTMDVRLVHEVVVRTLRNELPGRYRTLVDAHSGSLLYRTNEVLNCGHGSDDDAGADVQINATAFPGNPLQTPTLQGLPNLRAVIGGQNFTADDNGFIQSGVPGPVAVQYQLAGTWATVSTNGVVPTLSGTLNEGANQVVFDGNATIQQRSAYIYAHEAHAHLKEVLPDYTGLDLSLPVRVDLTAGDCNAFYDGSSINFYAEGNNCRALSTMNDVVYHEYGHGINGTFYQSLGGSFQNGGMNEGYADVWALTETLNPVLGQGFFLDDANSSVRRYDQGPKVYPVDITGQVHNDGEIICGAWWDTYLLLGNDMTTTLELFSAAFPGLQADVANGNEGQAFRDVLLDVLQADDDDGDITNGTVHGEAIVEAFGIHGITLISDATVFHDDLRTADAWTPISIEADVLITFPSTEYLDRASLYYRVNGQSDWTSVPMTTSGGSFYSVELDGQPNGTSIAYFLALEDIFGQPSSVTPIGANRVDPGLPYYILVGYDLIATENLDDQSELGPWQEGQPGDNATSGNWESGAPIASYSDINDPSTICQTGEQYTAGGELCWYTGNASGTSSGIGDNDVDGGRTTLLGPTINLAAYQNPAVSYWRWYTNNPPSGANPKADWWQVYASGDNGANWVPVENTKSGERNWRRKLFRVQDVLGDVGSIRLKFIASDSLRPGANLNGGSLIEAALDDVELWDERSGNIVSEGSEEPLLSIWPVPANGLLNIQVNSSSSGTVRLEVLDMTGRSILQPAPLTAGADVQRLDVSRLADGQYILRMHWANGSADERFSIMR